MKIAYKFNPEDLVDEKIPEGKKREARAEIARAVQDYILDYVGQGKSPVSGESWKKTLSKAYREKKLQETGVGYSNMELSGSMLDALEAVVTRGGDIEVKIEGSEAPKADGHNNFSGDSPLPRRRFIPGQGQTFKREILDSIRDIIKSYQDES